MINLLKYVFVAALFIILMTEVNVDAQAQGGRRVIQFSGIVVGEDSISGVSGVHIYVPKAGRGTTSNPYGYYSMPVLPNDSVVVSAVGYEKQSLIIPEDQGDKITVIIELLPDTTMLPEITIFPYPTEELFKKAILAYELPYQEDLDNMQRSLGDELLRRMYGNEPMSAGANHRYYMDQQMLSVQDRYQPRSIPLLNPFAWAEFIKSIKRGDLKNK
ncbi:MAG: carboxypeptidase-like regulatory domain-containing protein [Cyclobacteriaceae bacterium]